MQHINQILHKSDFISDFLKGQKDAQNKVPRRVNWSEAYQRGYDDGMKQEAQKWAK